MDTIIDEHTTNLKLEDYINYDEAVEKIISLFGVTMDGTDDIDVFNAVLKNKYEDNKDNNYQQLFSFIVDSIFVINNLNKYRLDIHKTDEKLLAIDTKIKKIRKDNPTTSNTSHIQQQCTDDIVRLKSQIHAVREEIKLSEQSVETGKGLVNRIRIELAELYRNKDLLKKPIDNLKKDIEMTEEAYLLLTDNSVLTLGLVYNMKRSLDELYENHNKLLSDKAGYEYKIKEKAKEKSKFEDRVNNLIETLRKKKSGLQKLNSVLQNNEAKLKDINTNSNLAKTQEKEIDVLATEFRNIYSMKVALEANETEHITLHNNLFKKYKLYDSVLFNTNDILSEIAMLYEQIDRISGNFGFKDRSVLTKINSYNFIETDDSTVRYKDFTTVYTKYYFNYKFLNIFGQIKENYFDYTNTSKSISESILTDNYELTDIIEGIQNMAYSLYNIYFSKENNYSMYTLGVTSADSNYNVNVMRISDEILNNTIEYCRKVLVKIVTRLRNNSSTISSDMLTRLFSDVTNKLKDMR